MDWPQKQQQQKNDIVTCNTFVMCDVNARVKIVYIFFHDYYFAKQSF